VKTPWSRCTITAKLTLVRIALVAFAIAPPAVAAGAEVMRNPSGFVAVTDGTGSLQISQYGLDGTLVRRLTTGPADHNYPSISSDGTQLLYSGDEGGRSEVYRRGLSPGSPATQLTREPITATSPSWAPDGRSIVYSALAAGSVAYQIVVAHPDGTEAAQLTHTSDAGNTQPVFSPDGRRIAYLSGGRGTNRIWVMNADGSEARALTQGPRDAYPQWLDASTVFFSRQDVARGTTMIMSVGLDGTERGVSPPTLHLIEPRPLPDGKSYGATIEEQSGLHLVRISRADGAGLGREVASDFIVRRLRVPATDGSSFTLAWIVSPTTPDGGGPGIPAPAVVALVMLAVAIIAGLALATHRKTNAC
jgi:dipeptidyl aminopeptidase/acylaminoacyl peptidase